MPKALFVSKNLIGDGLCIRPALGLWMEKHPEFDVDIRVHGDHSETIYHHMGLPLNVLTDKDDLKPADYYDFQFEFSASKAFTISDREQCHMVVSYGKLLGVDVENEPMVFEPEEEDHERNLILISAFSRSCTSQDEKNPGQPPNKMIPWFHWPAILTLLRTYGKIAMLGGPDDRAPLPVGEEEYYTGIPLNKVALMMRDCKLLVTLDNGMAHLGATQKAPMVEFYPACLGLHFMVPWLNNDKKFILHIDPATAAPAQTIHGLRRGLDWLAARGHISGGLVRGK